VCVCVCVCVCGGGGYYFVKAVWGLFFLNILEDLKPLFRSHSSSIDFVGLSSLKSTQKS
ncbi:MAG: hypothetical protein ACI8RD_007966, partial [Bacillariaceae sp.]|jgi:hypothetical protein